MIDFKSLTPSYERPRVIQDTEGLRGLGCSDQLVENVLIGDTKEYHPYVPPEEWFWVDRERFGRGGPWVEELYRIADGGFVNLPIKDQCSLLSLPVKQIFARKAPGKRARWISQSGATVTVEEAGLEAIKRPDEQGFNAEGNYLSFFHSMTVRVAKSAFKKEFDDSQSMPGAPRTDHHLAQMDQALSILLNNFEKLLPSLWERYAGAFGDRSVMTLESIHDYLNGIGVEFLTRLLTHYFKHSLAGAGHPDLTLIGPNSVRFVEVKSTDRLRGAQASWILNVARPLNLEASVVQIVEDRA